MKFKWYYTIDSLPKNETILYHATNLANKLGVRTKEKDNDLLILISKFDRKVAIATGLETENFITDNTAKKNCRTNNSSKV